MRIRKGTGVAGAGTRDRWVTIQARPEDEGSGFPTEGPWVSLATIAMAREDLDADEIERTSQQIAISTTRWEMPYMPAMDPEQVDVPKLRRLLYYGRTFDIISATPIGRAHAIALVTEAHAKTPTETAP